MLTDNEVLKIRAKMKQTFTTGAMLARKIKVSRQMINGVLKQRFISERVENALLNWLTFED